MAAANTPAPKAALTGKRIKSYLMRTTGPQLYFVQPWASLTQFNIPKNVPLNLPLAFITMEWRGRITPTASYTPLPEAPQSLIQNFKIQGTHNVLGSLVPFNLDGATLFALNRILGGDAYVNRVGISDNGGPLNWFDPFFNFPNGFTQAQFGTATHTYDTIIEWVIPVYPYSVPDDAAVQYLWNANSWGQTLQLQIITGDQTSLGTTLANAPFTAFGSATGSPVINLGVVYASLGPLSNAITQAVAVKNAYNISGQLTSVANVVRLFLLQNQRTLNVLQKTGVAQTGTSAGVSVFASLSDLQTEQSILRVNNNPIRNLFDNLMTKSFYAYRFGNAANLPTGYLNISFEDGQPAPNPFSGFEGEKLSGSAQFDIAANVISAPANASGIVLQDMIYGEPVIAGAQ